VNKPRLSLLRHLCVVSFLFACAPHGPRATAPHGDGMRAPRFEDAFGETDPSLVVVLFPRALMQDRVYGPLLRRASELASAQVGVAAAGATALVAFERSDEVVVAMDASGHDAVVALVGAPADLDPSRLIDTDGRALWKTAGDVRAGVSELSGTGASLFVLPGRTWIICTGATASRAREALGHPPAHVRTLMPVGEEIARIDIPGDALRQKDARLREGALAPVGRTLQRATVSLLPGSEGLVLFQLAYPDAGNAAAASTRALEVVQAFRRKLTDTQKADSWSWLAAAGVERTDKTVTVRAPLPRSWLEALAKAQLDAPADPPAKPDSPGNSASGFDRAPPLR
jgi:hypothetical protein